MGSEVTLDSFTGYFLTVAKAICWSVQNAYLKDKK